MFWDCGSCFLSDYVVKYDVYGYLCHTAGTRMIKFACKKCGKEIHTKDELAGLGGKCPHCGEVTPIPPAELAAEKPEDIYEKGHYVKADPFGPVKWRLHFEPKTSILAVASVVFSVLAFAGLMSLTTGQPASVMADAIKFWLWIFFMTLFGVLALLLGILAYILTTTSSALKGRNIALVGIIISIVWIISAPFILLWAVPLLMKNL